MKDAYYFPHDSNAKDDPKCVLLIEQLGLEGYGIFWILIETLRDQPEYKYPVRLIPAIARRYNSNFDKVYAVITQFDLFEIENEIFFFSKSLIERMKPLENKREMARLAGLKSAEKRKISTSVEQAFNNRSTSVEQAFNNRSTSKVKESKLEESKEEKEKNIFFKISKKEIFIKPSDYVIKNAGIKLDVLINQYELKDVNEILKFFDSQYIDTEFQDDNHLKNALCKTFEIHAKDCKKVYKPNILPR
jgi:hypothetical protein